MKSKINKKRNLIKKIFIFLIMILIVFFIYQSVLKDVIQNEIQNRRIEAYGEPIDIETGTINNMYFEISKDGTNPDKTTKGINRAIVYAYKNNIKNIKLEKGNYAIKIDSSKKGISIYSNINLDLNTSCIQVQSNSYTSYRLFYIKNESNIKIFNGTLIGDKDTHDYDSIQAEHQWGYGVHIRGGENIELYNLEIYNFIGDGIYIDKYKNINFTKITNFIKVYNNNIHDCRRQGISIIDGNDIQIYSNEIHDISGSSPQAGIDLEANEKDEGIRNIKIYENKFYNFGRNFAIQLYEGVYSTEIYENEVYATIRLNDAKEEVKIYNNKLENGKIDIYLSDLNINNGNSLEKVIISDNTMKDYSISADSVKMMIIEKNLIEDGKVEIKSSNARIYDNIIKINKFTDYVYKYSVNEDLNEYYVIETDYKEQIENCKETEMIQESKNLLVKRREN